MAAVSGRMRPRIPPRSCVAPRTHFVWPGATRRCFALLGLSRRGAMRLCGERLGSVGVRVGACGSVGRVDRPLLYCAVLCCLTRRCFDLL